MKEKHDSKEGKRKKLKMERLRPLIGVDLCACGPINCLKCSGPCRESHKDQHGQVICFSKYQVDTSIFNVKRNKRRPRDEEEDRPKTYNERIGTQKSRQKRDRNRDR